MLVNLALVKVFCCQKNISTCALENFSTSSEFSLLTAVLFYQTTHFNRQKVKKCPLDTLFPKSTEVCWTASKNVRCQSQKSTHLLYLYWVFLQKNPLWKSIQLQMTFSVLCLLRNSATHFFMEIKPTWLPFCRMKGYAISFQMSADKLLSQAI